MRRWRNLPRDSGGGRGKCWNCLVQPRMSSFSILKMTAVKPPPPATNDVRDACAPPSVSIPLKLADSKPYSPEPIPSDGHSATYVPAQPGTTRTSRTDAQSSPNGVTFPAKRLSTTRRRRLPVVAVLGDYPDPCSNSHENPNVPAATHYTRGQRASLGCGVVSPT